MSIAKLVKLTVMGMLSDKSLIMSELQALGCLHLLPLNKKTPAAASKVSDKSDQAHTALRFLQETQYQRRQITRKDKFDVVTFVDKVIEVKESLRLANDKRDFLLNRIALFEPWGDIYFPPHADLKGHKFWFYVLPLNKLSALQQVDLPWQIVSKSNRFAYVVVIADDEPAHNLLPVERSHLGSEPLSELRLTLEDVEVEIERLTAERQSLSGYLYLFSLHLNEVDNFAALSHAHHLTRDEHRTMLLQGWIEDDKVAKVEALMEELGCAFIIEAPSDSEQPPTLIEQPEGLAAGKDLAMFYQVPDYRSWDPSRLLFFSFSVFFAMILADTGYGIVLLLGMVLFAKSLRKKAQTKAYFNLGLSLCGCTLIYGVMVGSYFGVSPPDTSILARLKILDLHDFDTMMTLSIVMGVVHICVANILLLLSYPSLSFRLSRIGWCGLILSAFAYWLGADNGYLTQVATITGIASMLAIFLFSSEHRGHSVKDWLIRLKDGVFSLANIMTAFGDILSYMRLFALGLASASLAITFNQLAMDVYHGSSGIGLLAAILIIAIGHVLNLLLSLISGVVHGLRLNYIEFYKWGLPKEGKAFRRFSKKEIEP